MRYALLLAAALTLPASLALAEDKGAACMAGQGHDCPMMKGMDHSKMDHGAMHGQMDHSKMDHSKMDHSAMGHGAPAADASASTKAYEAANAAMHKDMAIAFSGDADVDFLKGMIPHHEGAVAMAKVVLEHGKDAEVKKLAAEIIAAQEKEIAWMKAQLEKIAPKAQ